MFVPKSKYLDAARERDEAELKYLELSELFATSRAGLHRDYGHALADRGRRIAELERIIASCPFGRRPATPWGPSPASPPDFRPVVAYAAAGIDPTPAE